MLQIHGGIMCMRYEIRNMSLLPKNQEAMQMQAGAERKKKRAFILESDGKSEADINVDEGKKKAMVLNSEAFMAEQVNQAKGEAEAVIVKAQARAISIDLVATALQKENGMNAVAMNVAEQYVDAFSNLAKESNTVILPANSGDVSGMVTQALAMYKTLSKAAYKELDVEETKREESTVENGKL